MTAYKDKTWCTAKCATPCSMKLTPEVEAKAQAEDLMISQSDFSETCGEYVPADDPTADPAILRQYPKRKVDHRAYAKEKGREF